MFPTAAMEVTLTRKKTFHLTQTLSMSRREKLLCGSQQWHGGMRYLIFKMYGQTPKEGHSIRPLIADQSLEKKIAVYLIENKKKIAFYSEQSNFF